MRSEAERSGSGLVGTRVLPVALTFVVLAAIWLPTLRSGHPWGDDFAHYIMQGQRIASLRGLSATNYVANPLTPQLAPPNVPPGASVLLAPVLTWRGLDFGAMKLWFAGLALAGFGVFYLYCRLFLPRAWAIVAVLLSALNP